MAVLNTDSDHDGIIRHGNERVLRARFNDARFFWQTDQKQTLRDRVELLKHVTFQKDLGSYYEKTMRVQRLASWLSETVRQSGMTVRPGVVHKAALLAKTDLTTELVKEFTELQGIVGGLYVRAQQLDPDLPESTRFAIADAIYDHYKPESMEDEVPRTVEGAVLSIADKADSIAGMFALGLIPSGSKDPFALRRQANGIVKTIAEHKLPLRLSEVMRDARARYEGSDAEKKFSNADYAGTVRSFLRERQEFYLKDVRGFAYDVVNAVLAADADDVVDAMARAEAVSKARKSADFESISVAFKRTKNILRQASDNHRRIADRLEPKTLRDEAEKELAVQIPRAAAAVEKLRATKDYEAALMEIAKLRAAVDTFFDKVMVMVDDDQVRANRLALLQTLVKEFSTIADFSEIVTEGKESTK
jgi:glycyl-tRNA synthetase beta chain